MRRIVSYSIFRDPVKSATVPAEFYADRFPVLVRAHHLIWPEWEMHIYHDDDITDHSYWPTMRKLNDAGIVHLVPCGPSISLCLSMLWRLKPVFDPDSNIQIVSSRDVDSLPMAIDRSAVEEFIASNKIAHAIHAAVPHNGLMGGTTSFKPVSLREIIKCDTWEEFICLNKDYDFRIYGHDQLFLKHVILPMVQDRTLLHLFSGEGIDPPAETRVSVSAQPEWKYPDVVKNACGSEYVGHVYPVREDVQKFYTSLNVDPIFEEINRCER